MVGNLAHLVTLMVIQNLGLISLFGRSVKRPDTGTLFSATERGNTVYKLGTPKFLRRHVRSLVALPWTGAEIENQGGTGTAGSHWEKRVFMNDFMSGVKAGLSSAYTPMTFALLEDTGWYYANWASANIEKGHMARQCRLCCSHRQVSDSWK